MYAGQKCKVDLRSCFGKHCKRRGWRLALDEIDYFEYGQDHDLAIEEVWLTVCAGLPRVCNYDAIVMTPPCSACTRLRHENSRGQATAPLRYTIHPWGFPRLTGTGEHVVRMGNTDVGSCSDTIELIADEPAAFLLEHPEDLGRAQLSDPASI